jgi:hypothetical protein
MLEYLISPRIVSYPILRLLVQKRLDEQEKMTSELETRLKTAMEQFEAADARGSSSADGIENEIKELKRQIIKEKKENKPPLHPSYVPFSFNPLLFFFIPFHGVSLV